MHLWRNWAVLNFSSNFLFEVAIWALNQKSECTSGRNEQFSETWIPQIKLYKVKNFCVMNNSVVQECTAVSCLLSYCFYNRLKGKLNIICWLQNQLTFSLVKLGFQLQDSWYTGLVFERTSWVLVRRLSVIWHHCTYHTVVTSIDTYKKVNLCTLLNHFVNNM